MSSEAKEYQPLHYYVAIAQMLRVHSIADIAVRQLEAANFTDTKIRAGRLPAILFSIIKHHFARYAAAPDMPTIEADFTRVLSRSTAIPEPVREELAAEFRKFQRFCAAVDERSEKMARDIIKHIATTCVIDPAYRGALEQALVANDFADVASKIAAIEAMKSASNGGLAFNDIFSKDLQDYGERRPTGVPFIDSRFGGGRGLITGTPICIFAPQGHGKTSLGIQIVVAQALMGNDAVLVLAEEGLSLPLRRRIAACAIGIDTNALEQCNDNYVEAIAKAGINEEMAKQKILMISKHLFVLDMVKDDLGPEAIPAQLQDLVSRGHKLSYVYIDWAGLIANTMLRNAGKADKHIQNKEQALKALSLQVAAWAAKFSCNVVISHQMAAAAVKRGPTALNDMTVGEDCGGFTAPMKYCLIINPRAPNGCCVVTVAKARDDAIPPRFVVKLDGARATFRDVSDTYDIVGSRIVNRDGDDGDIPDA